MDSTKKCFWIFFLILVNFFDQASLSESSSPPTGFSARIFHRGDSHLSPGGNHYNLMVNHSINRLRYFRNILTKENDPVGYIASSLIMNYFIEINIGVPAITFNLDIDTRNHITWVQHRGCVTCIHQNTPSYDEKSSSTAREISCDQLACDQDGIIGCNQDSNRCSYRIEYADKSESSGVMFLDNISFSSFSRSPVVLEGVRFGAGLNNTKDENDSNISGVFGLSRNSRSFISQRAFKKFSYCIPSHIDMVDGDSLLVTSNMFFGTETSFVGNTTAMVEHPDYYIISLNGISIRGTRLVLDPGLFKQPNGLGSTIIDTGSPISFVPREAYNRVVQMLVSMIDLPRTAYGSADNLCFEGGLKDIDLHVPDMTLHFDELDLTIAPRSVFYVIHEQKVICLAMLPMRDTDEFSIFGALFQQNINIGLNIEENKIFIAPMKCEYTK